jgi:hypothetical protein
MDSSDNFFAITVATISSTPASITFGEVGAGLTKSDTLLISNTGTATLVISTVATGTRTFIPARTSFTIAPLSSDTLSMTFAPTGVQSYNDTLRLISNAVLNPLLVPLAGEGVSPTSVPQDIVPATFFLAQNYPNPFNPTTTISFGLPKEELVTLKVFNTLGQSVATLVEELRTAGRYTVEFSTKDAEDGSISSGIYFYRFSAGNYVEIRKMLLLK